MVLRRGVIGPAVAGLVVLTAGVATVAGWVDWSTLGRWLRQHAGLIVVFGAGSLLLAVAVARAVRRVPRRRGSPRALSWWVVAAAAVVVAGVAWGATAWLLGEANQAKDPPAARVEAIKTGLTIGAGTGGVFALLLAVRRQWHQELSSTATEHDAAERRVTELYTKAADQLGSDKAPVRLAGLYALERVAQNNPGQRQTIVNVLCAYLRLPYQLPGEPGDDADATQLAEHREQIQEREVRLTAQRLLTDHLRLGAETIPVNTYWDTIDLDLTGATLINFTLRDCTARSVSFRSVTFIGLANFWSATFTDSANFMSATFIDDAYFMSATFIDDAHFMSATFTGVASFARATFTGNAHFASVTFTGNAHFASSIFTRIANFTSSTFTGNAYFESTSFTGDTDFESTSFTGDTDFESTSFARGVPAEVARFLSPTGEDAAGETG
jgi:uncharacterized protein YjbI with pentapeptide repeats